MSVLRLEHVTKRFGGLVAVNDLSFEVKERQIHALTARTAPAGFDLDQYDQRFLPGDLRQDLF